MARAGRPKRGKTAALQGSSRNRAPAESLVPEVYQEMLSNATLSSPSLLSDEGQSIKRRRVGGNIVVQGVGSSIPVRWDAESEVEADSERLALSRIPKVVTQQTAYNDSEDSADSEMEWEEVDLRDKAIIEEARDEVRELELTLGGDTRTSEKATIQRRRPITSVDRSLRLEIHKMHVLTLLAHIHLRNHWCNDVEIQRVLRSLLSKKTRAYLDDDETQSQFQRSRSFMDGVGQAAETFRNRYKISARGMSRSYWAEDAEALAQSTLPNDLDLPIQKADFHDIAVKLEASRDIGAQLFCALLRSTGVDTRLVCSLQPLPITSAARGNTSQRAKPALVISYRENRAALSGDDSGVEAGSDTSVRTEGSTGTNGATPRIRSRLASRLGRSEPHQGTASRIDSRLPQKSRSKRVRESPYPIYWVEAFNAAVQKWVPIDPLVTKTIAKPSKFEPPASDLENALSYVIAFEDDGSARDVTRRYAKAYNAKTRQGRVEVTKGGEKWWKRVLRIYRKPYELDREQVEDAELAAKEAAEGMPRNVQDFKNHPYYALERHLKRSEVIHPKREVGKVNVGKTETGAGNKVLESIFRRRDVHTVKSADSWYRLGRELKPGEQPLKRVQPRRRLAPTSEDEEAGNEGYTGMAMYAAFQTSTYHAPPVVNGRVPKNIYGNLDVYVPSMVPSGGVHVRHSDTARAARILGIDYSDAVTGFEFRGRHGTAVVNGAIVAADYREAVEEVIRGFEDERAEAEVRRRSLEALRMWKRFLAGLRIRERIEGYDIEGEHDAAKEELDKMDEDMEAGEGGGFVPDVDEVVEAQPTAEWFLYQQPHDSYEDQEDSGTAGNSVERNMNEGVMRYKGRRYLPKAPDNDKKETADELAKTTLVGTRIDLDGTTETGFQDKTTTGNGIEAIRPPRRRKETEMALTTYHGLTVDEMEEAKMLQQFYESKEATFQEPDSGENPRSSFVSSEAIPKPTEDAFVESRNEHVDPAHRNGASPEPRFRRGTSTSSEKAGSTAANDEADRGSLLSHDPSDEDAEPEWLF